MAYGLKASSCDPLSSDDIKGEQIITNLAYSPLSTADWLIT